MLSKTQAIYIFILLNVCFLTAHELHNGFYDIINNDERIAKIFICTNRTSHNDGDILQSPIYQAAITFPYEIESINKSTPLFLFVPPVLKNISSVNDDASWLEAARVAMAWTSTFFRFNKHTKLKIIEVPFEFCATLNETAVKNIVCSLYDKIEITNREISTEKAVYQSIISFADINQKTENDISGFFLVANEPKSIKTEKIIIKHNLPTLKHGQKRFLITGAAGFLGSHLSGKLLEEGHQVIGLDNLICSTGENIQNLLANKNFNFIQHDASIPFYVDGPLYGIVHLASLPSPAFYYTMPVETLRSGLQGVFVTAELAMQKGARYFFSSTSEVYGDPEITPQVETYYGNVDPIGKRSQYDESKRGAEALLTLYHKKVLDVRIARIFNTYGPGMNLNDGRVVTNFIQALLENKPMVIHGNGKQTRSFCYVSDMVNGLYSLLMTDIFDNNTSLLDRVINLGNDGEFTINELAKKANILAIKYDLPAVAITRISAIDETDPKMRRPSLEKANKILSYMPIIPLDEGFEKTFIHFKTKK